MNMTRDEIMPYYQGKALSIVVRAECGLKVQFPAMHIRKYVTLAGVQGRFCLETVNNKFISLTKVNY